MKNFILLLGFLFSFIYTNSQTALNFDGVDDIIIGTNDPSLQLTKGTIEAWIKTDNAGNHYRGIIVKQYNFGIFLFNNTLATYDWPSATAIDTNINLADDLWHQVCLVFDDGVTNGSKLYVDGLPKLTFTYNVEHVNSPITIGNNENQSHYFKGNIDQVRVWNSVKTDAEVLASYNKCLTGTENGLVMLWEFEEGTGLTATDLSGNNNNGTLQNMDNTNWVSGYSCIPIELAAYYPFNGNANDESGNENHGTVNGATLETDRFGNTDSAYSFDGIDDYIECLTQVGPFGTDSRSISFWAKTDRDPNASIQQNTVLSYGQWPTGGGRFEILLNPKCRGLGVDVSTNYITKEFDNSDNNWHFYTVVYDNTISNAISDLKFYADGQLLSSTCNTNGNININTLNEEVLNIGRLFYTGQPRYFRGSIDDLKIYKSALSESDILSLYTNNPLNIEKLTETTESNFYISKNTLYFKNTNNINEIKSVEVYNLLGQQIFKTSKIEEQILLNNLTNGVFIAKVNTSNSYQTLKFIVN